MQQVQHDQACRCNGREEPVGTFADRAMGAAVLDASTYEAVEVERPATRQAFLVVLLSSIAAGVGGGSWDGPNVVTLAVVAGVALLTWLTWAALILYVGGTVFPVRNTRVDFGQLVRTIGFAAAPGVIQVFAIIPIIRTQVFVVAWLWMLAATVVAVRQALDYDSTWRALGVCVVTLAVALSSVIAIALALGVTVS
jgi:hypothetical protein